MNDTAGPNDLVPTLFVFGTLPRLPVPLISDFQSQRERMEAIDFARRESLKITCKRRVKSAVKQNVPSATLEFSRTANEDMVLIYRDQIIGK